MIFDKTGRRIKPGMIIDVYVSGMLTCIVTEVSEGDIVTVSGQPPIPVVGIQPLPFRLNLAKNQTNNIVAPEAYIVKQDVPDDAPEPKPGIHLVS